MLQYLANMRHYQRFDLIDALVAYNPTKIKLLSNSWARTSQTWEVLVMLLGNTFHPVATLYAFTQTTFSVIPFLHFLSPGPSHREQTCTLGTKQDSRRALPAGPPPAKACWQGALHWDPLARHLHHRPQVRPAGGQDREAVGRGGWQAGQRARLCGGDPGTWFRGDQPDAYSDWGREQQPAHS